jgi:16S rRNA (guanine527-N7)-methyltransferase
MNPLWDDLAARAGVALSPAQHDLLARYLDLLLAANATMNLTRITERAAAELHHVADSLTLLPFLPPGPHALADVGTGGGVPGIPLAIARPDAQVLLIESTKKKAAFLRSAVEQLGLANVAINDERAEDVGQSKDHRERYDAVVARAVAPMVWLAEWCLPLAKPKGGKVLAMKGEKVANELPEAAKAIKLLSGAGPMVHPVALPGTEHHVVVEISKAGRTDPRYPRPATAAKGKPLT